MAKYRRNRINDSVAEEAAQIIREIKDPRVSSAMITITGADVTADLKYAKIFYSVLMAGGEETAEKSFTHAEQTSAGTKISVSDALEAESGSRSAARKEIAKGLKSAAGFMRSQLAHRLNLRITPEIVFVEDHGVEHGAEIAAILKTITPKSPENMAQDETEEEESNE